MMYYLITINLRSKSKLEKEEEMGKAGKKTNDNVSFGKAAVWQTRAIALGAITIIIGYFSIYCTDTLGMKASVVGALLMASKIADGVTDLLAGYLVDNTRSKWGKGRPYEICIVLAWLATVLLFAVSPSWSNVVKCIWIFVMYTLVFSIFSTFLNAAEVPYAIRAFGTKEAVTKVSAMSGLLVTIGCMVVSISFPILMGKLATSGSGWTKLVLIYAVPLALIGILRFVFVKEEYTDVDSDSDHVTLKDMLVMLKSNKYAWCVAGTNGVLQFVSGLGAATYYFTWVVGDIGKYSVLQSVSILALVVMLFFPMLIKKKSTNFLIGVGAVLGMAGYALNFFAGSNMPLLVIAFLLTGIAVLPASYFRGVLIMDIAKYNQWKGLPTMESTTSALSNFFGKIFQALGAFMLGLMLDAGGYDGTLAMQPDSAMNMIRMLYSLIPMAIMAVMLVCTLVYKSLDKKMPQIEAELSAKKLEEA